jgi:hypothetical protein
MAEHPQAFPVGRAAVPPRVAVTTAGRVDDDTPALSIIELTF